MVELETIEREQQILIESVSERMMLQKSQKSSLLTLTPKSKKHSRRKLSNSLGTSNSSSKCDGSKQSSNH